MSNNPLQHWLPIVALTMLAAAVLLALPRAATAEFPASTPSAASVEALVRRLQEDERRMAALESQMRALQERVFPRTTNPAMPVAQANTLESRLAAVERRLAAVEGSPRHSSSSTDLATLEAKVRHLEAKVRKLEK